MSREVSRRDVLRGTAAAAIGLTAAGTAAASPQRSKSERLRFGVIGCGGKGWSGMQEAAQQGDIVAIADVDAQNRSRAMLEHPNAATFVDFREMIEQMANDMDAVVVSTPDHTHFLASMMAMERGLHCYCEKPLTRTIWETREMMRIARRKKLATQMGNQGTANDALRKTAAAIKSGAFGAVKEVHLWTDRAPAYWPQGIERKEPKSPPKHVNFDLWLGPAPERPFADGYHPFAWRGWWDFGSGALGDMGCHLFNMGHMALDMRDPVAMQAETSGHNKDSFPAWSKVRYEFAERNGRAPFQLFWYDGGQKPDPKLVPDRNYGGNGQIFICEKAVIYSPNEYGNQFDVMGGMAMPDVAFQKSPGHMAEFARAIRGGPAAVSNFPDFAGPLTETVLLGNLAIWASGPRLEWDARRMRVKGTDEYNALIKPAARKGWSA